MFLNAWKKKLYEKPLFGALVNFASPEITEFIARMGFDFSFLDNEHASLDNVVIENMIRASQCANVPAIVRVPYNRPEYIRKALDSGANGVQIPMVSTAQEALAVVKPANFPPDGERGVAFFTRSSNFGLYQDNAAYLTEANKTKLLSIHIETPEAVRNLEELLFVDGIDVYFVGPVDLATSMGYARDPNHPEVLETIERCIRTIKKKGKIAGTLGVDAARSKKVVDWGATYILTTVNQYMAQGAAKYLHEVRS